MQLEPGQVVLLKQTRERAKVIQALEDEHYLIEASLDAERFPVHGDELEPVVGGASNVNRPQRTADETQGLRLEPNPMEAAVQLAFIPVGELDFSCALLNFSEETLVYGARLLTNKGQQWDKHGILKPAAGIQLGHLYRDLLNESAQVEVQLSRKAAMGTDSKQQRAVKLKPKLFYKNTKSVDWFPEELAVFEVFAKAKLVRDDDPPTLKHYTQTTAPAVSTKSKKLVPENAYGVAAAANFPTELDLHIEQLVEDYTEMTGAEMLELQLAHMRKYLDVAIRLGVARVFLIHGHGKGQLRNRVHQELSRMGDLEGYRNEFHPKYGHGATEVILRP